MHSMKLNVSRHGLQLITLLLFTAILTVARYKKTYWLAPGGQIRLNHVQAAQLTQSGKIPYAREYDANTNEPTGDITFKEDFDIYNHPLNQSGY